MATESHPNGAMKSTYPSGQWKTRYPHPDLHHRRTCPTILEKGEVGEVDALAVAFASAEGEACRLVEAVGSGRQDINAASVERDTKEPCRCL